MNVDQKEFIQKVLKVLPERTRDIVSRRFSLNGKKKNETLESIGKSYNITRERVRQVERDAIKRIKKNIDSSEFKKDFEKIKASIVKKLDSFGSVKKEDQFLKEITTNEEKNYALFLLSLIDEIGRDPGNESFYPFWYSDKDAVALAKKVSAAVVSKFKKDGKPETLEDLFKEFKKEYSKIDKEMFSSCLEVSRNLLRTIGGEKIGLVSSPEVNPKTVKDKIAFVLKKEQKPLHFREITDLIFKFNKEVEKLNNKGLNLHPQTVHNELIKNNNFILIGRGLYALRDWGYKDGRVKDVIYEVLKTSDSPLDKEEVINEVLKKRMVKESTIFLGLQDKNLFAKDDLGKYKVRES